MTWREPQFFLTYKPEEVFCAFATYKYAIGRTFEKFNQTYLISFMDRASLNDIPSCFPMASKNSEHSVQSNIKSANARSNLGEIRCSHVLKRWTIDYEDLSMAQSKCCVSNTESHLPHCGLRHDLAKLKIFQVFMSGMV